MLTTQIILILFSVSSLVLTILIKNHNPGEKTYHWISETMQFIDQPTIFETCMLIYEYLKLLALT
jgi:hypothetical protein